MFGLIFTAVGDLSERGLQNGMMAGPWGAMAGFGGAMIGGMIIMMLIYIAAIVIWYMSLYHWGMTDMAVFAKIKEDKKKWFKLLVLLPVISGIIMIVPIIGWIAGFVGMIYWIVMLCVYFFSVKVKLDAAK